MKPSPRAPWLSEHRIDGMVQVEPALLLVGLALSMWLMYLVLLRNTSHERHRSLRSELANLTIHAGAFGALCLAFFSLDLEWFEHVALVRWRPWLGLLVLAQGAVTFVKSLKSLVTQALFLGHMREGVPALFINSFTVVASLVVGIWLSAAVFDFHVAPLLATSAIASVVLGLAVQDSLGNLFAGIAMQLDKPYEIGDWIEVVSIAGRWSGQVQEVTWRATVLIGPADELVSISNRAISQAQVLNYSQRGVPISRVLSLTLPLDVALGPAKLALRAALIGVPGVVDQPKPEILVAEITPAGITVRCQYWISEFSAQHHIADSVATRVLDGLREGGIRLPPTSSPPAEG